MKLLVCACWYKHTFLRILLKWWTRHWALSCALLTHFLSGCCECRLVVSLMAYHFAMISCRHTSRRPVSGWNPRAGSSVVTRHWIADPLILILSCLRPSSGRLRPSHTRNWAWTRSTLKNKHKGVKELNLGIIFLGYWICYTLLQMFDSKYTIF